MLDLALYANDNYKQKLEDAMRASLSNLAQVPMRACCVRVCLAVPECVKVRECA